MLRQTGQKEGNAQDKRAGAQKLSRVSGIKEWKKTTRKASDFYKTSTKGVGRKKVRNLF